MIALAAASTPRTEPPAARSPARPGASGFSLVLVAEDRGADAECGQAAPPAELQPIEAAAQGPAIERQAAALIAQVAPPPLGQAVVAEGSKAPELPVAAPVEGEGEDAVTADQPVSGETLPAAVVSLTPSLPAEIAAPAIPDPAQIVAAPLPVPAPALATPPSRASASAPPLDAARVDPKLASGSPTGRRAQIAGSDPEQASLGTIKALPASDATQAATGSDAQPFASVQAAALLDTGTVDQGRVAAPAGELLIARHLDLAQDHAWLDRLAQDIALSAGDASRVRFALAPEHLGRLTVDIANGADGTAVRLTAETEQAHRILADAQPRLIAEARAQGLRVTESSVDLDQRHSGQQQSAGAQQGMTPGSGGQGGGDRARGSLPWSDARPVLSRDTIETKAVARDLYA